MNQQAQEERAIFLTDDGCPPSSRQSDLAKLQRDYQSLQLENIILERHLTTVLDVIKSNPQLEELFLDEMHESVKRKRKQRHLADLEMP